MIARNSFLSYRRRKRIWNMKNQRILKNVDPAVYIILLQ
ncbi:hypothetical protein CHCC5027_0958 [Bacillus paralicheniformis]|nr:hypothetical protein CHCC5027_0958 [Bacillus paralicheniformis]TWK40065.1 hypothetical protein CHCC20348_1471 [Bacillus paralicheniformis]